MLNLIQARREIKKQYNIQVDFNLDKLGKKITSNDPKLKETLKKKNTN